MKIDWTSDTTMPSVPAGTYAFEIENAEVKIGTESGMEYISLMLRAIDDQSVVVFDNLSFSPKALNILRAKLTGIGLKGKEEIEHSDFIGRRVRAAVKSDTGSDGQQRLVIDIKAKGSHAGYFPPENGGTQSVLDMSENIPF